MPFLDGLTTEILGIAAFVLVLHAGYQLYRAFTRKRPS